MKKQVLLILVSFFFTGACVLAQTENALNFDNIDDQVVVNNASAGISGSNQITLTCWVKPMNTNINFPDYDGFAGIRNNADADFYLVQFGPQRVEARFRNSNGVNFDVVDTALQIGVWQHYALTYNGTELTLYRDGNFVATTVANGSINTTVEPLYIGTMPYGAFNYYMNGDLDEVTLWNRFLSPNEIRCLMRFGVAPTSAGLQNYYKCNQGTPGGINVSIPTLADATTHIDGSLLNFALSGPTSNFVVGVSTVNDITDAICPGSTYSFGSQTLTAPGVYTQTFPSALLCDSVVRLTLTAGVNDAVTSNGTTITAQQAGATYQWVDCNNGNQPIANETGQSFTPTANGSYAVTITSGSCTTTSACVTITTAGIPSVSAMAAVQVFPNPVVDQLVVKSGSGLSDMTIQVMDMAGRVLLTVEQVGSEDVLIPTSTWASGAYLVKVNAAQGSKVFPVTK